MSTSEERDYSPTMGLDIGLTMPDVKWLHRFICAVPFGADAPAADIARAHTIVSNLHERAGVCGQPPGWGWVLVEGRTTNSGKTLFQCNICGVEIPAPTKWPYHADVCFANLRRQMKLAGEERESVRAALMLWNEGHGAEYEEGLVELLEGMTDGQT